MFWRDGMVVVWPGLFRWMKRLSGARRIARGCAWWPFLFIRDEEQRVPWLLNHERIHLAQQRETLLVGLFLVQLVEFFWARVILRKTAAEAYYWQSFEQEAYLNQHDLGYLARRRPFAFVRHMWGRRRFRVTEVPGEIVFD
jgi:hypothetical protein